MFGKKRIKVLRGDDLKSVEKGVKYAKKGRQAKILDSEGKCVMVIGTGNEQLDLDENSEIGRPAESSRRIKKSSWFD